MPKEKESDMLRASECAALLLSQHERTLRALPNFRYYLDACAKDALSASPALTTLADTPQKQRSLDALVAKEDQYVRAVVELLALLFEEQSPRRKKRLLRKVEAGLRDVVDEMKRYHVGPLLFPTAILAEVL